MAKMPEKRIDKKNRLSYTSLVEREIQLGAKHIPTASSSFDQEDIYILCNIVGDLIFLFLSPSPLFFCQLKIYYFQSC